MIKEIVMRAYVYFQDERIELDLPDESLIGVWNGPGGMGPESVGDVFREALEGPLNFPPLRQMVVPGDRVAIALDDSLGDFQGELQGILEILAECGVDAEEATVISTAHAIPVDSHELPRGLAFEVHDPGDSSSLAYLATTKSGRRIYLNRRLTDADVVIPVGRLGFDPVLGYRGPWSVLFPGLSDRDTLTELRSLLPEDPHGRVAPRPRLDEEFEVSWLLGTQFQLGVVPGSTGVARFVAGLAEAVRDQGIQEVQRFWTFRPPTRAECVLVGVGAPGRQTEIGELVEGLVTASRVVQHGGRIVALSRAMGPLGPSLQRLIDAGDVKEARAALRGHDDDPDSITGRQLARVLSWADVYLLSGLDRQTTEDLLMIPLERAEDARRLVGRSGTCLVIGRAEWTRATARDEEPG
jgi:nickel-dependent lactate racemase